MRTSTIAACDLFDTFYVNEETRLNFALQNNGLPDLREQNRIVRHITASAS